MRNKDLDPKIGLPLKVITARLEHVKINLTGLIKRVEAYAIDRQKSDFDSTVEDCMTDFIDTFFDENKKPDEDEITTYMELQKKLINLILWFSQKEPDFRNLTNEPVKYKPKLELVKRELRLFEANKYKPTIVGTETNRKINDALKQREDDLKSGNYVTTKKPHPRKPHWNFYWLGKRGSREKWVNHWIPFKIVGGVPKDKTA